MDIIPIVIKEFISLDDAFLAIYILAAIAAIEGGIIAGLATRVGSLRNLFRLTAAYEQGNNSAKKKNPTDNYVNEKKSFKGKL